ncbi:MAG TPA: hypothetical protein VME68_11935 [Acidobacteriaceae bacterium]|nr:hypothetical protein [Acidobacteriaceae bacterium]
MIAFFSRVRGNTLQSSPPDALQQLYTAAACARRPLDRESRLIPAKFGRFPEKTRKNRKKPVETRVLPLTNAVESRKVNGGRFFRTRVITGVSSP